MPYKITKQGDQFCVVKAVGGGKPLGCHPTEDKAKAQMKALYAQESEQGTDIKGVAQERFDAFEAVWTDNAEGLPQADVVIIRPGMSKNRREYPPHVISAAVQEDFWGGTPMFVDHGDPKMPRKRKVGDLVAKIEKGTSYVGSEGEARAKVTFLRPEFAVFARGAQESVGLSAVHEFMGQRYKANDGHYQERVNKFLVSHSVDFVAWPAAGGGIAEFLPAQESEDDDMGSIDFDRLTPELLDEKAPTLVAQIVARAAAESDEPEPVPEPTPEPPPAPEPPAPEGYVTLAQAKAFAQEAVERYDDRTRKVKATNEAIKAHLAKSGLPEKTRDRLLTALEGEEYKANAVQEAINEAAAELKETGWRGPVVKGIGDSVAAEASEADDPATLARDFPTMAAVESQLKPKGNRKIAQESTGKAN